MPAIIGGIISSVSIPILTSVTAPSGIVQISPASSSPTLTNLGREGKSGGWFFRTITTDALQGVAAAKYALDPGLKRLTVIHVNNDFGVNMVREFSKAYAALGGQIISVTPYNPSQASYQPEVTRAIQGNPDALYLVSYPGDGTTIARTWISQGGVKKFLLNDGMNSAKFIADVGAQHLNDAYGTSSGTTKTPSTEYFAREYPPFSKFDAGAPAADRSYDAAAILGLAIAQAGKAEPAGDPRRHPQGARSPRARSSTRAPPSSARRSPSSRKASPSATSASSGPCSSTATATSPGRSASGASRTARWRRSARCRPRRSISSRPSSATETDEAGPRPACRASVSTGTAWEALAGYARAVRVGDRSSCPARPRRGPAGAVGAGDPAAQARFILDRIERALESLGGRLRDVVRTRVYVRRLEDWEAVARVHGERFGDIRPANTLVQARSSATPYLVEIEAEAVIGAGDALQSPPEQRPARSPTTSPWPAPPSGRLRPALVSATTSSCGAPRVCSPRWPQATERIEIGTGILNPHTIHPAELAMLAATMDELTGDRFNLGLGAGAADFLALGRARRIPSLRRRCGRPSTAVRACSPASAAPGRPLPAGQRRSLPALHAAAGDADLPGRHGARHARAWRASSRTAPCRSSSRPSTTSPCAR